MTGAPVFLICEQIKEEKKPPAAATTAAQPPPPPPLSAVPGGFLKQLVRETEKETRHKEPELKEEKTVRSHCTGWDSAENLFINTEGVDPWWSSNKLEQDDLPEGKIYIFRSLRISIQLSQNYFILRNVLTSSSRKKITCS